MSVRVTARLIGDVVIASGLPKSPPMIVQAIDEEAKMVHTTWFSNCNEAQEGAFPGSALDRLEPAVPKAKKASPKGKKPSKGK